jgi:Lon protease-like protein
MRKQQGFGVVLIEEGSEAGTARFVATGTRADIIDWNSSHDGLLALVVEGRDRFTVTHSRQQSDGLYVGDIEFLPPEPAQPVPERHRRLSRLLATLFEASEATDADMKRHLDDATWVGFRLAESLPLPVTTKQSMLELTDPIHRLELLAVHVYDVDSLAP